MYRITFLMVTGILSTSNALVRSPALKNRLHARRLASRMCTCGSDSGMKKEISSISGTEGLQKRARLDQEEADEARAKVQEWADWVWPEAAEPGMVRVEASTARSTVDLVSDFWVAVGECVAAKEEAEARGGSVEEWLVLLTAPGVSELEDYESMSHLDMVLDYCKNTVVYPANEVIRLMHYHPRFRGAAPLSDRRWHNELHAPHPTLALIICNGKNLSKGDRGPRRAIVMGGGSKKRHWKETAATDLEILFNTAVASSGAEQLPSHGAPDGKIPDADVVREKMNAWIGGRVAGSTTQEDELVGLMKTVTDVVVSKGQTPQDVYHDVWETIGKLTEESDLPSSVPVGGVQRSVMIITPHYACFNYGKFERFAYSMDRAVDYAPLAHKFRVEAFHPEFVGKTEEDSELRRAPFPCLQISFYGKNDVGQGDEAQPPLQGLMP